MVLKKEKKVSRVSIYFIALLIPSFLCLDSMQSLKYVSIQREIRELEKTEAKLIEKNKTLIADISNLSSTSRIEAIAVNELAMRKATSSEIMRVEVGR
ncbi:MAG TPA: septum formation initiator family protein [Treponemataceae bacterium]|jgi:cell division protein FtsL|nr:septum formation initiator family protein [Spirochaetota bacterium]HBG37331.1 cell division protein FtsL [Treponema sp.]HOF11289.1 septum formation initiator family protein [Treponemataceae bacterium]HOQ92185.1 septum formation initiator family protein [Treponemataceae bacterium]HPM05642.1 septum formation initiator family protein [Treponemataceae bacterium]